MQSKFHRPFYHGEEVIVRAETDMTSDPIKIAVTAGREDGTLARIPSTAVTPEKIEPFRPARLAPDGIAAYDPQSFAVALLTTDATLGISELRGSLRYVSFPAGDRIREIPVGGLVAQGQFAFWSNGREARHIDLQQGFAETMAVLSGSRVLPGGVGQ